MLRRLARIVLLVGILEIVAVLGIWLLIDRSAAEKTAAALAQPCGLVWTLLIIAAITGIRYGKRTVGLLTTLSLIAYTVGGNGFLAWRLASSLEAPFYSVKPLKQSPFDVVIVLGGGASTGGNGRMQGNSSGDRLILTAQLYHAGLTPEIICTGTRIDSVNSSGFDPGEQSEAVLLRLGVPESVLTRVGGRTTAEEMDALGKRFAASEARIGLVTSAWHLRRAMTLAERNGLKPLPLPSDFLSGPYSGMTIGEVILSCIPQGSTMFVIGRCTKEYLAMAARR